MTTKKQIGGPGYTGTFIVVTFKSGKTKLIDNCDITHDACAYYAQYYDNVRQVSGYEKNEPFQSAIEVSRYGN